MFLTFIPDSFSVPLISLKANSFATCRSLAKAVSFKCCLEQSCPKACLWYSWNVTWLSQVCRLLNCKPADVIQSRKSPSHLHWLIDLDGLLCPAKWFWTRERRRNLKNFLKSPCPRLHTPQDSEENGKRLKCWSARKTESAWNAGQQNKTWLPGALLLSSCSCEGLLRAGLIWNWAAMFDRRLMSPQTKCLLPGVSLWAGSQARGTLWWKESRDVLPCEGTQEQITSVASLFQSFS